MVKPKVKRLKSQDFQLMVKVLIEDVEKPQVKYTGISTKLPPS